MQFLAKVMGPDCNEQLHSKKSVRCNIAFALSDTVRKTVTESNTETDKFIDTEANGNLCWCLSLCSKKTTANSVQIHFCQCRVVCTQTVLLTGRAELFVTLMSTTGISSRETNSLVITEMELTSILLSRSSIKGFWWNLVTRLLP